MGVDLYRFEILEMVQRPFGAFWLGKYLSEGFSTTVTDRPDSYAAKAKLIKCCLLLSFLIAA